MAEPSREDTAKEKGPPAPRHPGREPGFELEGGVAMGGFSAGGLTRSGVFKPHPPGCRVVNELGLHSQGEPPDTPASVRARDDGCSKETGSDESQEAMCGRWEVESRFPLVIRTWRTSKECWVVPGFGARTIVGGRWAIS